MFSDATNSRCGGVQGCANIGIVFSLVEFEEDSGSGDDSSVVRAGAGDLVERGAVGVGELNWVFFASDCACFHAFRLTHDLHCGQALGAVL